MPNNLWCLPLVSAVLTALCGGDPMPRPHEVDPTGPMAVTVPPTGDGEITSGSTVALVVDKLTIMSDNKDLINMTVEEDRWMMQQHLNKLVIVEPINQEDSTLKKYQLQFIATLATSGALTVNAFTAAGNSPQWALFDMDSFNEPISSWENESYSTCGKSIDSFLGGSCKYGATKTGRQYFPLTEHKRIRITGRVHFFDKWIGDALWMKIDGNTHWTEAYHWCPEGFTTLCTNAGIDACGRQYPDRLSRRIDVAIPHKEGVLAIEFGSTLPRETNPCDVSWGIDDIALWLSN